MIVKRKLYSVMGEEEQREFAKGTKEAGKKAMEFLANKGNKIANKSAKRISTIELGRDMFDIVKGTNNWAENRKLSRLGLGKKIDPNIHSLNDIYLINGRRDIQSNVPSLEKFKELPYAIRTIKYKTPGDIESNKRVIRRARNLHT